MCGIAGCWGGYPTSEVAAMEMAAQIRHRGPDNLAAWSDQDAVLSLAHCRLSILDLSVAGNQPMHSSCGRYVMVFNGEIYNFRDIRSAVDRYRQGSIRWRGHSDTEVLLEAIVCWGIEITLRRSVGMFALALWDRKMQTLTLARDRFGEKPLYYGFAKGHGPKPDQHEGDHSLTGNGPLLFGSELKALMAHPEWKGTLALDAIESYLRFGCIGGEHSIFQGVAKLPPGALLQISVEDLRKGVLPSPERWWSAAEAARSAMEESRIDEPEMAVAAVEEALGRSVRERMIADVPLGAFLSGGVDSSLIVALMQQQAGRPVRTFTVGFDDARYDESEHAEAVAAHLGTEHLTMQATSQMALDLVSRLPDLYDEPFADSSQLPTILVSRLIREHVTVALSGDAGDELFGGYNRHQWVPKIWDKLRRLPLPVRYALGHSLKAISSDDYDRMMRMAGRVLPERLRMRTFGEKLHKLADVLESRTERALFVSVASMNNNPALLLNDPQASSAPRIDGLFPALSQFNRVEWMLLMDTLHYMVDDVLVKVDRASMASSLEVRVPYLDPEVFRAAWRIPATIRLRNGQGKWILRQLLDRYVPRNLIERPKMGFAIPLDAWLRGPLRAWADDLLSPASVAELPMLNPVAIQQLWQAHLNGQRHYAQQLWAILQLLAWQRRWHAQIP